MITREANANEHAEVARLTVEGYREYAAQMSADAWAEYEHDLADVEGRAATGVVLAAEVDGTIAGALSYYGPERIEADWLAPDWAYFRALAVLPAYRERGVGRALTMASIARARAEGAAALALHTTEGMPLARAMYERMGFVQQTERQGSTWKVWLYALPL
ncbi:MAG: GNAT family N-acetyltransferase [Candidatus Dormibacteria bacterium]